MTIIFYEKPGCINNGKQRRLLEASGHQIEVRSIIDTQWTLDTLSAFFDNKRVENWFNTSAPSIKTGDIDPACFNKTTALQAMLCNPILIKRPLIECELGKFAGFDHPIVKQLVTSVDYGDLLLCSNKNEKC